MAAVYFSQAGVCSLVLHFVWRLYAWQCRQLLPAGLVDCHLLLKPLCGPLKGTEQVQGG